MVEDNQVLVKGTPYMRKNLRHELRLRGEPVNGNVLHADIGFEIASSGILAPQGRLQGFGSW